MKDAIKLTTTVKFETEKRAYAVYTSYEGFWNVRYENFRPGTRVRWQSVKKVTEGWDCHRLFNGKTEEFAVRTGPLPADWTEEATPGDWRTAKWNSAGCGYSTAELALAAARKHAGL